MKPTNNLGPLQIQELNEMLSNYVEVPRAQSLLNMRYIPTPPRHRSHDDDFENMSNGDMMDDEEYELMLVELYRRSSRYELDMGEYERGRLNMVEYVTYRRKFE